MATTLSAPTEVRFELDVMEEIKLRAQAEHRSVSDYIRKIMTDFVRPKEWEADEATWQDIKAAREAYREGRTTICDTEEDILKHLENL